MQSPARRRGKPSTETRGYCPPHAVARRYRRSIRQRAILGRLAAGSRCNGGRLAPRSAFQPCGPRVRSRDRRRCVVASMPVLAAEDIAAGRLVVPFDLRVPLASAYFLVCHESASARPAVALFREWLLEEATRDSRPT